MASSRKSNALFIDEEALSALALLDAGLLLPVRRLMNRVQTEAVLATGLFNGKPFPFPFILAPSGKVNDTVLQSVSPGDTLELITNDECVGTLLVEEVFPVDANERVRQIYGTDDPGHPGVRATLTRLGRFAVCGELVLKSDPIRARREAFEAAKADIDAEHVTAVMMAANPLHRAHERLIRMTLEKTDLLVIFLLKPFNDADLSFEIRRNVMNYFIENFVPQNRVIVVPLEHSYLFAGYNEVLIDAIVAHNFGCDRLMIGQNHAGVGLYYSRHSDDDVLQRLRGTGIDIAIVYEYVYCDQCKTLVSIHTCPHGHHHHISYSSDSILELIKVGLLPPAVLMRKELSAMIMCQLFPDRIKNLEKLHYDMMPTQGLLEMQTDRDFYIKLMELYQTTSLT